MNDYDLGSIFRKLRKEKNLTLKDVAKDIKVSPAMLSLIENGNSSPSLKTVIKLALYYDVSMSSIFSKNIIKNRYAIFKNRSNNIINEINKNNNVYLLLTSLTNRKMKCSLIELVEYCDLTHMTSKKGESFLFIIDGKVEISNRCNRYYVSAGDSIYIDNKYEIGLKPIGCSSAKIMRVEREF